MVKIVEIKDFNNLDDASMWLEQILFDNEVEFPNLKGELLRLPDGRWRGSMIAQDEQMEFDFGNVDNE